MPGRGAPAALHDMTHDDMLERATERFERRLAEECGRLRIEIATGNGELRAEIANRNGELRAEIANRNGELRAEIERGFGLMRTEMGDRNTQLLQWGLVYAVTMTGVGAALLALFR